MDHYQRETVDSAGDERVVNNVVRHEYRVLSDAEKERMKRIKDLGAMLIFEIRAMYNEETLKKYGQDATGWAETGLPWELQNAHRSAEEAVMWGVKYLTK